MKTPDKKLTHDKGGEMKRSFQVQANYASFLLLVFLILIQEYLLAKKK